MSKKGALEYRHCDFVPDYWAELPEDKAPKGRVLLPKGARESMSDGGEVAIRTMSATAKRDGVDIRTGHRVQRVIKNAAGEIIGVEADTAKGKKRFLRPQGRGVLHRRLHPQCRAAQEFLRACRSMAAAQRNSNEGDFVYIASTVGAQLRNMNYAWMCPIVAREGHGARSGPDRNVLAVRRLDDLRQQGRPARRQRKARLQRDGAGVLPMGRRAAEYPNLLLIAIWDQRSQEHSASDEYGRFIVPPGTDDATSSRARRSPR